MKKFLLFITLVGVVVAYDLLDELSFNADAYRVKEVNILYPFKELTECLDEC
jgi:hypothetical protein